MLTGWGFGKSIWSPVIKRVEKRFRIHAFDLRDYAGAAEHGEWSERATSRLLEGIPRKAHLTGWSLGGMLAIMMASAWPDHFRSLSLMATNAMFQQRPDWPTGMPPARFDQFWQSFQRSPDGAMRDFVNLMFLGEAGARHWGRELLASRAFGEIGDRALAWGLRMLETLDVRAHLQSLALPVMAIQGGLDRITPPQALARLAELHSGLEAVRIPDAGHAPFLTHEAVVAKVLHDFWRAQSRRPNSPN